MFVIHHMLIILLLTLFNKVTGLTFITEPNKTTMASTGSNQTFFWKLSLTEKEKTEQLQVQFGSWDKESDTANHYLITFVKEPSGTESVLKANKSISKRLFWVGNLTRDYFVAFKLFNTQRHDSGDYGIRVRVEQSSYPVTRLSWFSLSVQDPPPLPTTPRDAPTIHFPSKQLSVELLRGNSTTLKCVATANPSPTFAWYKRGKEISYGFNSSWNSSTLTVTPVNDNDFTSYMCTAKNMLGLVSATFILQEKVSATSKVSSFTSSEGFSEHFTGLQSMDNTAASVQRKDDEDTVTKYLSITAVVAVIVICAFLIRRYLTKRSRRQINNRKDDEVDVSHIQTFGTHSNEASFLALNLSFSGDPEWEIPRANLNVEKVIGRGAFGVVSRGMALDLPGKPGWTVVAVKSIQEDASEKEKRDLLSEMSLLKHLDPHHHVICLYGCVTTEARPLVVVEYAQYGDVLGYLRKSRGVHDNYYSDPSVQPRTSLTSKQLLKFAWEISDGMDYLSKKKIIHRDLAARNVLVGDGEVCKITDFGMARDVQEEDIYVRTHEGRLPIKWTAPEALFGSGSYTTASDVWSFGVVMYEIFTVGGDPFPGVYMREIPALLKNGYRMTRPKFVSPKLYYIMMECWKNNPSERPSFEFLRSTLHNVITDDEQEYVNLQELFYENVLPSGCSGE